MATGTYEIDEMPLVSQDGKLKLGTVLYVTIDYETDEERECVNIYSVYLPDEDGDLVDVTDNREFGLVVFSANKWADRNHEEFEWDETGDPNAEHRLGKWCA